jgi:hypothetical protein
MLQKLFCALHDKCPRKEGKVYPETYQCAALHCLSVHGDDLEEQLGISAPSHYNPYLGPWDYSVGS